MPKTQRELILKNGSYEGFREGRHAVIYETGTDNEVARVDVDDAAETGLGNFLAEVVDRIANPPEPVAPAEGRERSRKGR